MKSKSEILSTWKKNMCRDDIEQTMQLLEGDKVFVQNSQLSSVFKLLLNLHLYIAKWKRQSHKIENLRDCLFISKRIIV